MAYCIPCNTEDARFPHTCAIGPIQKKLDDAIWAKEAAEGCNAATQFLLDEAKRERDALWDAHALMCDLYTKQGDRLAEMERNLNSADDANTALLTRVADLQKELEAAYKAADETWVTHQQTIADRKRIAELEKDDTV